EQVEDADDPEEAARDARADVPAVVLEGRDLRVHGLGGEREARGQREHDRGVPEREEEADAERALPVLEELPRRVVDRGDGGCGGTAAAPQSSSSALRGAAIDPPYAAADFALADQDGRLVRLSGLRGDVVLVTFLYTHCPDVCPRIAASLNGALRDLGTQRSG